MQLARSPYLDKLFISITIVLLFSSHSFCYETEDPIRNGGGARPIGMGRAVTAVLNDVNAAYYNPAGLMGIRSAQFTGMYYTKVYGNYHYFVAAGATPTELGVFGLGFLSSGIGQIPITTTGTASAYAEYTDNLVFLTYADSLNDLNPELRNVFIGANLKLFSKGTTGGLSYNANGVNMDLGLKYIPFWWLSIGVNKQNVLGGDLVWNSGQHEEYPSPLFTGIAVKDNNGRNTYSFDVEFPSYLYAPTLMHFGVESQLEERVFFRAGLDQAHDSTANKTVWNPAFGVGILLKGISIDYAFHPYYEDPGYSSHFVSLSFVGEYESGIKARAGTLNKKAFEQAETVDLSIKVPFEVYSVTSTAPNDEEIKLTYDPPTGSWVGSWNVPQGFRTGTYDFKATVIDLEGKFDTVNTNDIFVKEGSLIRTVEVVTIMTTETASTPEMAEKEASRLIIEYLMGETLDPQKLPTRGNMAKILSLSQDYTIPSNSLEVIALFKDLDSASPEAGYITACYVNKAIIGYTDKTFKPNNNVKYADLIAMMSDSEPLKTNRQLMWTYLEKINKGKIVNYDDMLDAFAASHYLDHKMTLVTSGTLTGGKLYIIR